MLDKKQINIRAIDKTGPTREYATVPVDYIGRLYARIGNQKAVGEMIGVTGTCIGKAIRDGVVAKSLELAARQVYTEQFQQPELKPVMEYALIACTQEMMNKLKVYVGFEGGTISPVQVPK